MDHNWILTAQIIHTGSHEKEFRVEQQNAPRSLSSWLKLYFCHRGSFISKWQRHFDEKLLILSWTLLAPYFFQWVLPRFYHEIDFANEFHGNWNGFIAYGECWKHQRNWIFLLHWLLASQAFAVMKCCLENGDGVNAKNWSSNVQLLSYSLDSSVLYFFCSGISTIFNSGCGALWFLM